MRTSYLLSLVLQLSCLISFCQGFDPTTTCSVSEAEQNVLDPALQEMKYDVGDGEQSVLVYVQPDVTTFYKDGTAPASTKVQPKHKGLVGKFINISNKQASLYWEDKPGGTKHLMRSHEPFGASGTATFPGHRFLFTDDNNKDAVLTRFVVGEYPNSLYVYDPYTVEGDAKATEENLKDLTAKERAKYDGWRKTLSFNEQYRNFTGRTYLANYLRKAPMHYMWPADYFGQEHWATSRETQFVEVPPDEELDAIFTYGTKRILGEDEPRNLQEYRDPDQTVMNMTMTVLSCAPRVFEIKNFLSAAEVAHMLNIAGGVSLSLSSTGDVSKGDKRIEEPKGDTRRTRTSYNSWLPREKSPIIDAIYRRAADLMRIDEALLRHRGDGEYPDLGTEKSLAEQLQLVHYNVGQEYTAHHDFGFSKIDDKKQGARYATLLLYLNEDMNGGETAFPRWQNAETFKELMVAPEVGKAVLFYSQLPDGNFDDFSHHAAQPVQAGGNIEEKWLTNLWTWDPEYGK